MGERKIALFAAFLCTLIFSGCAEQRIRYPNYGARFDCPRGRPKAVLKKSNPNVLSSIFRPVNHSTARETARLKGNIHPHLPLEGYRSFSLHDRMPGSLPFSNSTF